MNSTWSGESDIGLPRYLTETCRAAIRKSLPNDKICISDVNYIILKNLAYKRKSEQINVFKKFFGEDRGPCHFHPPAFFDFSNKDMTWQNLRSYNITEDRSATKKLLEIPSSNGGCLQYIQQRLHLSDLTVLESSNGELRLKMQEWSEAETISTALFEIVKNIRECNYLIEPIGIFPGTNPDPVSGAESKSQPDLRHCPEEIKGRDIVYYTQRGSYTGALIKIESGWSDEDLGIPDYLHEKCREALSKLFDDRKRCNSKGNYVIVKQNESAEKIKAISELFSKKGGHCNFVSGGPFDSTKNKDISFRNFKQYRVDSGDYLKPKIEIPSSPGSQCERLIRKKKKI